MCCNSKIATICHCQTIPTHPLKPTTKRNCEKTYSHCTLGVHDTENINQNLAGVQITPTNKGVKPVMARDIDLSTVDNGYGLHIHNVI